MARLAMTALVAALVLGSAATGAAERSSLRGLRAPGLIDFGPVAQSAMPLWQMPGEVAAGTPQPSPLYGFREMRPGASMAPPARLSYSYSDSLTGVLEAGPALRDPYTSGYALSGQLVRSFANGMGIGLGLRQRLAGDNLLALGVKKGWGAFSGGYTLYSGRGDDAAPATHRFALNFDYGNRSSIGLSYTSGRDLQTGLLPYVPGLDSRDWAITGHHWLAPQWAVTYDVVNSDQAAYRRQGLRFGIRHTF